MKGLTLVLMITSTMLVACSEGDIPDTGQVSKSSEEPAIVPPPVEMEAANPLLITASMSSIAIKQTTSFSASGGTGPYTYAVVGTSAGSLSNNIFTASVVGESVKVRVTDSVGVVNETSISVAWPALREVLRARAANGYHFYTTNPQDPNFATFSTAQGVGYRLLQNEIAGETRPVYRCYNTITGGYYQSIQNNCENLPQYPTAYQNQGVLGHAYLNAHPGLVRIQRFAGGNDHVDSIKGNQDPDVNGYSGEGAHGYGLPPAAPAAAAAN